MLWKQNKANYADRKSERNGVNKVASECVCVCVCVWEGGEMQQRHFYGDLTTACGCGSARSGAMVCPMLLSNPLLKITWVYL